VSPTRTASRAAPATRRLAAELRPRLNSVVRLLRREASLGLTPQQTAVLNTLSDGAPRRMSELAECEQVSQPTMTVLVDRLERHEWVTRETDSADRRVVRVRITAAGKEMATRVAEARIALLAERLTGLSDDDRAAIAAALPALGRLVGE
jgi:DNA-binding MarR family transcriptional regulator